MASSFSDVINKSATAILTVTGLVAVAFEVADRFDSPRAGKLTAVIITLLLGVPAARFLIPTKVQRRFGIRRYKAPPILASSIEHVEIASDFSARIDTTQTFIFTEQPGADDLVDIIDVLPTDAIDESSYSTPDSDITDIVRQTPSTLAVRWRPRVPIIPFVPHVHETSYNTPPVYGEPAFYQGMYVDRDTGYKDWEIVTAHPIEKTVAFLMPRMGARVTDGFLYSRYADGRGRGCEQPTLDPSGHRIRWILKRPEKGRTYVLFAVYAGRHNDVIGEAENYRLINRIRSRVRAAMPWLLLREP